MSIVKTRSVRLPHVLFQVKDGLYAVASENVREILILPAVAAVPNLPPEIRGVINLRGRVIHVVDLRIRLGMPSAAAELQELIQLLEDREQDHQHWLAELEACVNERRPFTLSRDPHQCKFGLWYDQFQTEDALLRMLLQKMDEPHKAIHAMADAVLREAESGAFQAACSLIAEKRAGELAALSTLFEEARRVLREHHRELAIVLARGEERLAISIDLVQAVEPIPEENIEPLPTGLPGLDPGFRCRIGKRAKTGEIVLLLDPETLFSLTQPLVT